MFVSLAATPEAFLRQVEIWAKETAWSEMQLIYAESKQTTRLKYSVDWKSRYHCQGPATRLFLGKQACDASKRQRGDQGVECDGAECPKSPCRKGHKF